MYLWLRFRGHSISLRCTRNGCGSLIILMSILTEVFFSLWINTEFRSTRFFDFENSFCRSRRGFISAGAGELQIETLIFEVTHVNILLVGCSVPIIVGTLTRDSLEVAYIDRQIFPFAVAQPARFVLIVFEERLYAIHVVCDKLLLFHLGCFLT